MEQEPEVDWLGQAIDKPLPRRLRTDSLDRVQRAEDQLIAYCHVRRTTGRSTAGHWFFHTGADLHCASATFMRGRGWILELDFVPLDKPEPTAPLVFRSKTQMIAFIESFFGGRGEKVPRSEFPD